MSALDEPTDIRHDSVPFHLRGNYAPVMEEVTAVDLPVIGRLPAELEGRFVRNGANPATGTSMHWFDGDGMLHGIRLRDGKAEWYRNRWVRTKLLAGGQRFDPDTGAFDLTAGRANTHVWRHAGRILALEEASLPNELSPELDTLGPYDFHGRLRTPMTAHPHTCAETGEMHFFGYQLVSAPYVTYHVADAAGNLVHSQAIDVPGPTMVHDFALSRHYAIFLDLPVVFSLEQAMLGGMPFGWDESYGARIGLLHRERARQGEQPTWFDIDPCYVFHIMNAWDEVPGGTDEVPGGTDEVTGGADEVPGGTDEVPGGTDEVPGGTGDVVHLDAGRHPSMWRGGADAFEPCYLWRWHFDLATGRVTEEQLDERSHGFPRIDDRRTGLANRFGWVVASATDRPPVTDGATGIRKYDLRAGTSEYHDFGPTVSCGEPVFVAASDTGAEDEGWVMTYTYDLATASSAFVVLDATQPAAPPVATVPLPQRVPHGFHGSWFED
jgi:carotenoid cleavage dioxygenase-like enzyme